MMDTAAPISSDDIVSLQRLARFGDIPDSEWAKRLVSLISSQPDVTLVRVDRLRLVEAKAGGSNGTLLFDATYLQGGKAVSGEYVLRFLPVSGLFKHYDVAGQFNLQRALRDSEVPVAPQFWLDADGTHLKTPGYVMGRVRGVSPPMGWRLSGLLAEASPGDRRAMMLDQLRVLAKIHAVDWRGLGLDWLERRAEGRLPIEREINWYWDSLQWAGHAEYVSKLEPIRAWLIEHEPRDIEVVLCHGDVNFGNYIFEENKVTAVVDWEMAYLGAPEGDLMSRQMSEALLHAGAEWPIGAPTHEEMFDEYQRITGRQLTNLDFHRLFCAYRSLVITILAISHFPEQVRPSFQPHLDHFESLMTDLYRKLSS